MIALHDMNGIVVAVFGLGRSGLAAARALHAGGARVWAWDDSEDRRADAEAEGIPLVDLADADWREPAALVLSPGIPHTHPRPHKVAALAREAGCEIVSDIELLGRAVPDATYVGVTGTNGKSTTTALIGHILREAGRRPEVGGNLGQPVLAFSRAEPGTPYVIELSSYQLERTDSIVFDVAVLLNIAPDHLDRHGGLDGYIAAKKLIFRRQSPRHAAIVGVDDEHSREIFEKLAAEGTRAVIPVSSAAPVEKGVYVRDGVLIDDLKGMGEPVIDLREAPALPGAHNHQNAAAAYAACRCLDIAPPVIAGGLRSFPGLPHRQEAVAVIDGIVFVNDSKATNADAAARALACYDAVYWIAGGRAKDEGLSGTETHYGNVRHVFLIGESADYFHSLLRDKVPATISRELGTAVAQAAAQAARDGEEGAVVLLSPACASFDQFRDFEARGDAFRQLVTALPGERGRFSAAHFAAAAGGSAP